MERKVGYIAIRQRTDMAMQVYATLVEHLSLAMNSCKGLQAYLKLAVLCLLEPPVSKSFPHGQDRVD